MRGGVTPRTTVAVVGDGAVGLLAVLSAKLLGAERIILMGRHKTRTDLGREFGATDVVAERGQDGIERVRELTHGQGVHVVLEAVGARPAPSSTASPTATAPWPTARPSRCWSPRDRTTLLEVGRCRCWTCGEGSHHGFLG